MANIPLIMKQSWSKFHDNGLLVDCAYTSVADSDSYDSTTSIITKGATTVHSLNGKSGVIFGEFNQTITSSSYTRHDDVPILAIDRKVTFPKLNLSVVAKVDDLLTISGDIWIVKGVSIDPARAMYKLHVRPND